MPSDNDYINLKQQGVDTYILKDPINSLHKRLEIDIINILKQKSEFIFENRKRRKKNSTDREHKDFLRAYGNDKTNVKKDMFRITKKP